MDTRAVIAARSMVMAVMAIVGAGVAQAQEVAGRWRGPWQVEGRTSWRHVGGRDDALILEGRLGDVDVCLRGRGDARGLTLTGTAERVSGEPAVWRQDAMRLEARATASGTLEVTLEIAGEGARRERWVKPTAPTLRVGAVVTPATRPSATEAGVAQFEPRAGDLVLEVVVEGRPIAVALQVLAASDDPRYAHLDGVVHHVDLGGGAPLPVGRHRVTWSGTDRSFAAGPLLPGRYTVTVVSADAPLGPPPGEAEAPNATLFVVVPDAPAAITARATPADRQDGGLASRLAGADARAPR